MGLEQSRQPDTKRSSMLEAGLVALTLLGAHDNVRAAEIPQNATWEQGVTELRRSVMKESVEYAAVAATLEGGRNIWPRTIRGEADGVQAKFWIMFPELVENSNGEAIQSFCDIHTHPVESTRHEFNIPEGAERAYAPPSAGDAFVVTRGGRQKVIPESAARKGLQIKNVTSAVFEPHGIWYYRTLTDPEREQYGTTKRMFTEIQAEFIEQVHEPFTTMSVRSDFQFETEYEKLRTAYRQMIGTEIRFVSYDDLKKEPPCAGTDYRPARK